MLKILLICSLIASCGDACREVKNVKTVKYQDNVPKCRIFYYMTPTHLKDVTEESCDVPRPDYIKVYTVINGDIVKHVGKQMDVDLALAKSGLDKNSVNILMLYTSNTVY